MVLVDVIPMTLGWMSKSGDLVKMLKKNTKIPSQHTMLSASEVTTTTSMGINIVEGERHLAMENLFLGRVPVETRLREVSQWKIHFEVDTNGILTASIQDQLTNNIGVKQMERSSTSLTKKDIDKMQEDAKAYKEDDQKETRRLSKKNKLLTACVNIRYNTRVEERFTSK